jgi:hypothetical protein
MQGQGQGQREAAAAARARVRAEKKPNPPETETSSQEHRAGPLKEFLTKKKKKKTSFRSHAAKHETDDRSAVKRQLRRDLRKRREGDAPRLWPPSVRAAWGTDIDANGAWMVRAYIPSRRTNETLDDDGGCGRFARVSTAGRSV